MSFFAWLYIDIQIIYEDYKKLFRIKLFVDEPPNSWNIYDQAYMPNVLSDFIDKSTVILCQEVKTFE